MNLSLLIGILTVLLAVPATILAILQIRDRLKSRQGKQATPQAPGSGSNRFRLSRLRNSWVVPLLLLLLTALLIASSVFNIYQQVQIATLNQRFSRLLTPTNTSTLTSTPTALATATPTPTLPSSISIAVDVTTSKLGALHASTVTTSPFSTSSPNELLLAFISSANATGKGSPIISSVSGAGLIWVEAVGTNSDARGSQVRIFRAFATSILTSQTVTATSSDSSSTVFINVVTFTGGATTGTNGAGAIGAIGTATGVSNEPSKSIITTRNHSWVWGVGSDPQSDTGYTPRPGLNQTVNASGDNTTDKQQHWVNRQNATTPSSGTTATINDALGASDVWELAVIEILPRSA